VAGAVAPRGRVTFPVFRTVERALKVAFGVALAGYPGAGFF